MKLSEIILMVVVLLTVSLISILLITNHFQHEEKMDFCKSAYPPVINEISTFKNYGYREIGLENGWIKCCRSIYLEHEKTIECEVIRYDS